MALPSYTLFFGLKQKMVFSSCKRGIKPPFIIIIKMDKIDEVIIEACKIEDEETRVKVIANMLKVKNSGNEFKSLLDGIKRSLEWD